MKTLGVICQPFITKASHSSQTHLSVLRITETEALISTTPWNSELRETSDEVRK